MYTPRIGFEVSIGFIEGDIDRPVITGGLYNGQDLPPFSAGGGATAAATAAFAKYGSPEGVIAAGTRSNPAMDILTGIAKVEP